MKRGEKGRCEREKEVGEEGEEAKKKDGRKEEKGKRVWKKRREMK